LIIRICLNEIEKFEVCFLQPSAIFSYIRQFHSFAAFSTRVTHSHAKSGWAHLRFGWIGSAGLLPPFSSGAVKLDSGIIPLSTLCGCEKGVHRHGVAVARRLVRARAGAPGGVPPWRWKARVSFRLPPWPIIRYLTTSSTSSGLGSGSADPHHIFLPSSRSRFCIGGRAVSTSTLTSKLSLGAAPLVPHRRAGRRSPRVFARRSELEYLHARSAHRGCAVLIDGGE